VGHVRSEIEHTRVQVGRQRKEILQLQRAGIATASAELLLQRMLAKNRRSLRRARSPERQSRAVPRKGASLAGGVGDAGATETVRWQGGELAFDLRALGTRKHLASWCSGSTRLRLRK
jgi:hypothetical protein